MRSRRFGDVAHLRAPLQGRAAWESSQRTGSSHRSAWRKNPKCPMGFAAGSTVFSYLLLRGRMIPVAIAWLGVFGSALVVVILPLQLAGLIAGPITQLVWIPVALFELTLAPWLLIKGVAPPVRRQAT